MTSRPTGCARCPFSLSLPSSRSALRRDKPLNPPSAYAATATADKPAGTVRTDTLAVSCPDPAEGLTSLLVRRSSFTERRRNLAVSAIAHGATAEGKTTRMP